MTKKDKTYCSIIKDNCIGFKRKNCNECMSYKQAVKEAYYKTIERINNKYRLEKDLYQKQLTL
jgi:hypothetical protein